MDICNNPTNILITGATGFVGSYLVDALSNHPQFAESRVHLWQYAAAKELSDSKALNVDIRNSEAVAASIQSLRPTHVVHLAAQSHVPTSFENPHLTWDINVMGTLNLLEALKKHAPHAGVLYVSSSEVYGKTFQCGHALDEASLLQPQNPYAASKAAADIMAGQYATQGLKIIRMRPFNHIGPGQSEQFVASAFASQIARIEAGLQQPVLSVGNLEAMRDFLDVRDVVNAYILALEHIEILNPGQVLNICSGNPIKISELLHGLLSHTDCDIKVQEDPARLRPSDIPVAVGDPAAVASCLGWQPGITLDKTLGGILAYWRNKLA